MCKDEICLEELDKKDGPPIDLHAELAKIKKGSAPSLLLIAVQNLAGVAANSPSDEISDYLCDEPLEATRSMMAAIKIARIALDGIEYGIFSRLDGSEKHYKEYLAKIRKAQKL